MEPMAYFRAYPSLDVGSPGQVAHWRLNRESTYLPVLGIFLFIWHRHQIEGTNGLFFFSENTDKVG